MRNMRQGRPLQSARPALGIRWRTSLYAGV